MVSDEELKTELVRRYLDERLEFERLAECIGRRDAAAVRESKAILDSGDTLAGELADL